MRPIGCPKQDEGHMDRDRPLRAARALPSPVRRLSNVMDDTTIRPRPLIGLADPAAAEATYGHISTWETRG